MRSRRDVQPLLDVHDRHEVRHEAFVNRASLALFTLAAAVGCNTPPKEAHDGAATPASPPIAPAPASASTSPPASPAPPPASSGSCTKDDDCRTFSSYCAEAPCACRVVSASEADPKCLGASPASSKVRCFADPCMHKAARCQSGACVLTAR